MLTILETGGELGEIGRVLLLPRWGEPPVLGEEGEPPCDTAGYMPRGEEEDEPTTSLRRMIRAQPLIIYFYQ